MSARAQELLNQATQMIDDYVKDLENEEPTKDLRDFDKVVRDLCDEVTKLPKDEAENYKESIVQIGTALESLAKKLEERKDAIKDQIEGLGHNKKAQSAYLAADGLAPSEKQEEKEE